MEIAVCIKQVPSKSVCLDKKSGRLNRGQGGGQLNPKDYIAVETALKISEAAGGRVTALCMGPETAEESLRTALSMGADRAVLISDRAFAGADVYATAFTLSQAVRALGGFDIIVCGQQSADGGTSQLPFSLAAQLGIPCIGWVKKINTAENGITEAAQELSFGTQTVKIKPPFLLAAGEETGKPRLPGLRGQLNAKRATVVKLGLKDMEIKDSGRYGQNASPTSVVSVRETEQKHKNPVLELSPSEAAELILKKWEAANGEQ